MEEVLEGRVINLEKITDMSALQILTCSTEGFEGMDRG